MSILSIILRYFSPVLDISTFNRLFIQFYVQNVVHTFPTVQPSPESQKSHLFVDFVANIALFLSRLRYFTFNRPFHTILRAERSVHVFQRRNKPRNSKIAIIRRFCRKLRVISIPFKIFQHFITLLTPLYLQNVVHRLSSAETSPEREKSKSFVDFDENYALFFPRLRYFDI